MRAGVVRAAAWSAALCVSLLVLSVPPGQAQTAPSKASGPPPAQTLPQPKPVTGFVPTYEIMRTVRAAGFEPLAPPLRDGTVYALRATDFRGILMHVVVDARTGVIRDVTRIVSDATAPYGMMAPAYAPAPYGSPPEYDATAEPTGPAEDEAVPRSTRPAVLSASARQAPSRHAAFPPLPRPRPRILAARKPEKPAAGVAEGAATRTSAATEQPRAGTNAAAIGDDAGADAAPPTAQGKPPVAPPIND